MGEAKFTEVARRDTYNRLVWEENKVEVKIAGGVFILEVEEG